MAPVCRGEFAADPGVRVAHHTDDTAAALGLCLLGGIVAACGYAACSRMCGVTGSGRWRRVATPGYAMALLLLLSNGAVAAWVARQIRSHVEAALDEAETRRKMERSSGLAGGANDPAVAAAAEQAKRSGFDIAAWNRPADQTGANYYDWQLLPDGELDRDARGCVGALDRAGPQ